MSELKLAPQSRVALYARVSTDEQREGQTIKAQIAELERFVKEKGWIIAGTYKDDGWSGSMLARPSLDHLRDDAAKQLFDVVIVNDVDRLARDVAHLGIIKGDLERKKVALIFRKLPAETSPTHNLMVNILGSFAEFERSLIIDRTRRGRRHKVEFKKEYVGCSAPYGYRYFRIIPPDKPGRLEINSAEALVVRQMYHWAGEGQSMTKIARRLTDLGIPTSRGAPAWGIAVVHRILRNEMYAGVWSYGRHESCEPKLRRNHQPYRRNFRTSRRPKPRNTWLRINLPKDLIIIERSLWLRAQERIDQNPKYSPRNVKNQYLLRGLLTCGYCPAVCSGTRCRQRGRSYFYYCCTRRCRESRWTPMGDLESAVWNAIRRALMNPKQFMQRAELAQQRLVEKKLTAGPAENELQNALNELEREEVRLMRNYRSGTIPARQLGEELEELNIRKTQLRAEAAKATGEPDAVKQTFSPEEACKRILGQLAKPSFEQKQEILRRLIVTVAVKTDQAIIKGRISEENPEDDIIHNDGSPVVSAIASPPLRECTGNCRTLEFKLIANLPGPASNSRRANRVAC